MKKLYIATVVDRRNDGEYYGITLHDETPQALCAQIVHYLKDEEDELELKIDYTEEQILRCCSAPNTLSGPEHLSWDDGEFEVYTEVVDISPKVYVVNLIYGYDETSIQSSVRLFYSQEKARAFLKESYEQLFDAGSINDNRLPGMFYNINKQYILGAYNDEQNTEDQITIWSPEYHLYFEGIINTQDIE